MIRPIAIGLSPNTEADDYSHGLKMLLRPKEWQKGEWTQKVEQWFLNFFQVSHTVSFNAGRSALLAILKSLELAPASEVLLQAYTCVAVPNSVIWAGLRPVYVDIDESLNIDIADASQKITPKSRVLIVQHTFGMPADMDKISKFCKKHNLILIEDCAHALGATYKGKLVGSFGTAAFFSFGRDKIVSSVFGGMATTNNESLGNKLRQYQHALAYPSLIWILQQLLHPLIMALVLPTYRLGLGKIILYAAQHLRFLSFPVYAQEKQARQPEYFPKRLPNALSFLAYWQLEKLKRYNAIRRNIAKTYFVELKNTSDTLPKANEEAIYLRFPILSKYADELRFQAKKKGILLGNWYSSVIDPKGVDFKKILYTRGSCPKAEKMARQSLNLPTYPTLTQLQIKEIIELIKKDHYYRTL